MNDQLLHALRARYATPQAVCHALGLDEALLPGVPRTGRAFLARLAPLLAQDANPEDVADLLGTLKGAAGSEEQEAPDYEDDDEDVDYDTSEGSEDEDEPDAVGDRNAQIRALLAQLQALLSDEGDDDTAEPDDTDEVGTDDDLLDPVAATVGASSGQAQADAPGYGQLYPQPSKVARDAAFAKRWPGSQRIAKDENWGRKPTPQKSRAYAMDSATSADFFDKYPNARRLGTGGGVPQT